MTLLIRTERPSDYHRIAEIHAIAFDHPAHTAETVLVDALRHRKLFDPELFLVAEWNGEVVAHVAFSPHQVRLGGETVPAVNLAPIATHPDFQNKYIGAQLIEEGHRLAAEKGYQFSFLLGHPNYYPRFGYQTKMFGTNCIKIDRQVLPTSNRQVEERRPVTSDIPALQALWAQWFADCDLALIPGDSLTDWISTDKHTRGVVALVDGELAGYLRYDADRPEHVRQFLARDQAMTTELLAHINRNIQNADVTAIHLPVHPNASTTQSLLNLPFQPVINTWEAAMIKILNPDNNLITTYCDQVGTGQATPGILQWPVEFDVC